MTFTSSVASQECQMGDRKYSAGSTFMQLTVVYVYNIDADSFQRVFAYDKQTHLHGIIMSGTISYHS